MAKTLDDVLADVEQQNTVVASAVTLMDGLSDALKAAKGDPAKIDAIIAGIDANKQALADAVVRNTPAEEPPAA